MTGQSGSEELPLRPVNSLVTHQAVEQTFIGQTLNRLLKEASDECSRPKLELL